MRIIIHGVSRTDTHPPTRALQAAMRLLDQQPGTCWGMRIGGEYFSVIRNQRSVTVRPAAVPNPEYEKNYRAALGIET